MTKTTTLISETWPPNFPVKDESGTPISCDSKPQLPLNSTHREDLAILGFQYKTNVYTTTIFNTMEECIHYNNTIVLNGTPPIYKSPVCSITQFTNECVLNTGTHTFPFPYKREALYAAAILDQHPEDIVPITKFFKGTTPINATPQFIREFSKLYVTQVTYPIDVTHPIVVCIPSHIITPFDAKHTQTVADNLIGG